LNGNIKPVLTDVDVESTDKNLGKDIIAKMGDATLRLLSEDTTGEHKVATVLPIRGKITNPKAEIAPTVIGVFRNAFVEGLGAGFANLPLPTAAKKQGVIEQAVKGLEKKQTPKAQPVAESPKKKKGKHHD